MEGNSFTLYCTDRKALRLFWGDVQEQRPSGEAGKKFLCVMGELYIRRGNRIGKCKSKCNLNLISRMLCKYAAYLYSN